MKLLDTGFIILLSLLGLARKASCNLLLGLLFPLRNLIWMHAMLAGKLGQALLPRQGIKGDAGLEFGGELPSRFGHKKPPLTSYVHLSSRSSFPNPLLNYVPKEYDELIFKKFDYAGTIQKNAFYQTLKNLGEPEDAKNIIDMLKNDEISIDEEAYEAFIVSISNGIYSDDNFINLQPTENRNIYSISNSYIDLSKDTDLLVSQFGTMLSG